ncbi:hypothetical protein PSECIP111854_03449 [Pseudoalteromonas sp. CIP111854]|uniref:HTH araC/xylS-type domain-containing protein n=1 Tax=Pseudoalteromonas holothuriae TaxID=2963714 RepID=A0A9W4R3D1_9GAMM|nr:hypothetical protein PSECIP111854_03449 [Pseudoalteromonas sp. CIP111854]
MVVFLEQILILLGCVHALILSLFLLKQRTQNPANIYLSLFTGIFSFVLFFIFLDISGIIFVYPHLIGVQEWLIPLLGPLLFLYVLKLTAQGPNTPIWYHFIPSMIIAALSVEFLMQDVTLKSQFISAESLLTPANERFEHLVDTIIPAFSLIQITCYLLLIFKVLKHHAINVKKQFSYLEKVNLAWLLWLSKFIAVLLLLWLIDELIALHIRLCFDTSLNMMCNMPWVNEDRYFYPSEIGIIICVYAITYYALKQPAIFYQQIQKFEKTIDDPSHTVQNTPRYANSALSEPLAQQLFNELDAQVKKQQIYTNPILTLDELANITGWSRHQLSQAINQVSGRHFFDYINMLRIESAKQLLLAQPQKTVLEIALETGFNSRSAFYTAFKKCTQQTPTQYKKAQPLAIK